MSVEPTDQELLNDAVRSTEQSILDHALADEPVADEPAADEPATSEESDLSNSEQPRDERGQFAPKDKAAAGDKAQQDDKGQEDGEQAADDDKGGENDVPRWRLREIAEARRQAEARAQTLETELARMRGQLDQLTRGQPQPGQPQQPKAEDPIDPLLDPQGFARQLREGVNQTVAEMRLNHSMEIAHVRHGEAFEKAYGALLEEGKRGNGALIRQLTSQPNPGEAVVRWHREREVMATTKGDLNGFKKQIREELLKDPEFLRAAVEAARGQAAGNPGQPGSRPNTITRIPPSLSRQAGSSANVDPIDTDDSESAVFSYAFK